MSKFTPGPWKVAGTDKNGQAIVRSEHIEVATCWHHSVGAIEKEMHANAHLIAAAPDLLRELQSLVGVLWPAEPATTADGCYTDDPKEKCARAAIAKALGMSSPGQIHQAPPKVKRQAVRLKRK